MAGNSNLSWPRGPGADFSDSARISSTVQSDSSEKILPEGGHSRAGFVGQLALDRWTESGAVTCLPMRREAARVHWDHQTIYEAFEGRFGGNHWKLLRGVTLSLVKTIPGDTGHK